MPTSDAMLASAILGTSGDEAILIG